MKKNLAQLKKDLEQLKNTKSDPSTSEDVKKSLEPAIAKLESLIAEAEKGGEEKPAPAAAKEKKPYEGKKRGRKPKVKAAKPASAAPKKAGRPKKAAESQPAKKSMTALEKCKEIIARYRQKKETDSKRIKQRRKQGKPAELTAPETLNKAAKSVKAKVVEMDRSLKVSEETAIINSIVQSVTSALAGIEKPHRKKMFINKVISNLRKLDKSIKLRAEDGMKLESEEGGYMAKGGEILSDVDMYVKIHRYYPESVMVLRGDGIGKGIVRNDNHKFELSSKDAKIADEMGYEYDYYKKGWVLKDDDDDFASGGYMKRGGNVNYGAAWTRDRKYHNKRESYEVPMKKRKLEDGGSTQNRLYPNLSDLNPTLIK